MGRLRGRKLKTTARSKLRKRKKPNWKAKWKATKGIRKHNKNRKPSSLEILVYQWLIEANIPFKKEYPIGRCHVDLLLEPNICIEINGCYYHSCPICYTKQDSRSQLARAKDSRRYAFFRSKGFDVVIIWGHEITDNPSRVKETLKAIGRTKDKDSRDV